MGITETRITMMPWAIVSTTMRRKAVESRTGKTRRERIGCKEAGVDATCHLMDRHRVPRGRGWGSDAEEDGGQWQGRHKWCMCCGEPQSVLDGARKRRRGTGTMMAMGRSGLCAVLDSIGSRISTLKHAHEDGGRRWEAADRAAGTAGCGGMRSGLADPRREGNDRETPEEARVGCDGPQEWLEGSASWGGRWGQVAGNGGLRQHGEWVGRPKRAGHDGGWSVVGAGSGQRRERRAVTARGAGWPTQKRRDTRGMCLCEVLAGCNRPRGRRERGRKREVRGGKPDWAAGGRGAVEAEVVPYHKRTGIACRHFQGPQTRRYGTVNNELEGSGSKLPFSAGRDSTATHQQAAGSSKRPSTCKEITQKYRYPSGVCTGEDP
ncbi:hypothetical protein B0H10DRAFT_1967179 [Mycena sp. CBHHK59/15]|nr:hypothetical protein B0H10DRAFT_1967179 [Mycena sp. CBHHK59/15]